MIDIAPELVIIIMFGGLVLGSLTGHPIAFVLTGIGVIITWIGIGPHGTYLFIGRVFDTVTSEVIVAIPLFVLMATFLDRSGIASMLFNAIMYQLGGLRGGLGLTVVVMSVVFAASTGIIGAAVVGVSLIAMPTLLERGYSKELSSGVICAGGSLGILIPPSIMLVMMADQSPPSIGALFAGAMIPGLLLGGLFFVYIVVLCRLKPDEGPALPKEEMDKVTRAEKLRMLFGSLMPPVLLILSVLGSIWFGFATPTEAAGVGAFLALVLMIVYGKFTLQIFYETLIRAVKTNCMVMATLIGATIFTGAFMRLRADRVVTDFLLGMEGVGAWAVVLVMMLIVFIMGFFIDWIGIIFITFPIYIPIANSLGLDPLWFVIALAVNLQMSFITPPFGYALFYLRGTAPKGVEISHIYRGILPFIGLQAVGLLIILLIPQLVLWFPKIVVGYGL